MSSRSSSSLNRAQLIVSLENPYPNAECYQTIRIGYGDEYLDIELRRTLRVLSDDAICSAPAGFGTFPIYLTEQFAAKVPKSINGGAVVPIYQREAMWISFNCVRPFAVKVFANGLNIISGKSTVPTPISKRKPLNRRRSSSFQGPVPQDYVVPPKQLWLDGSVKVDGVAEQFVANPVDGKYTVDTLVESQNAPVKIEFEITPTKNKEMWIYVELATEVTVPRLRLEVHPKENVRQLIDEMLTKMAIPLRKVLRMSFAGDAVGPFDTLQSLEASSGDTIYVYLDRQGTEKGSGIGAGTTAGRAIPASRRSPTERLSGGTKSGGVRQIIEHDFMPFSEWDTTSRIVFPVHLIRACNFKVLTGLDPPPTPISAAVYAEHNIEFEEQYIEPGMLEEVTDEVEEDAGKENKRPDDENVYDSPAFQDDLQENGLAGEKANNLRIMNAA